MIRRPPRSTLDRSSAASDVYKRQLEDHELVAHPEPGGADDGQSREGVGLAPPAIGDGEGDRGDVRAQVGGRGEGQAVVHRVPLSLIHISEPTRPY